MIAGQDKTPVEISYGGVVIYRRNMATRTEEADNIIIQQMLLIAKQNPSGITVLSDDTDVFVLLLHYYLEAGLQVLVLIESAVKEHVVVDIGKTVEKHR